jgi:transcriptional regulator with XRE-family HTH domain
MEKVVFISGPKMKQIRERLRPEMRQEDLAKKMGKTRVTIIQWENAQEKRLNIHDAERLAKVLRVSLDEITVRHESKVEEAEVKYPAGQSIDMDKIIEKMEKIYQEVVDSYEKVVDGKEEIIQSKEGEVKRLHEYSLFLQETIRELTKGFASLKKV